MNYPTDLKYSKTHEWEKPARKNLRLLLIFEK